MQTTTGFEQDPYLREDISDLAEKQLLSSLTPLMGSYWLTEREKRQAHPQVATLLGPLGVEGAIAKDREESRLNNVLAAGTGAGVMGGLLKMFKETTLVPISTRNEQLNKVFNTTEEARRLLSGEELLLKKILPYVVKNLTVGAAAGLGAGAALYGAGKFFGTKKEL